MFSSALCQGSELFWIELAQSHQFTHDGPCLEEVVRFSVCVYSYAHSQLHLGGQGLAFLAPC